MILEKIVVGPMQVNCYIVGCARTQEALVIDPGDEPEKIKRALKKHALKAIQVLNTHGHIDHIGQDTAFGVGIAIHRLDADFLNNPQLNLSTLVGINFTPLKPAVLFEDGQKVAVGDITLEVVHTPGHTPGSICLYMEGICFTGDTLFAQGVGRTDFSYSSEKALLLSIRKRLMTLPDETVIYPGHGSASTIGIEKKSNPFL
ncbi:MAG: MBL fold metallo-hydrolase [Candidatus Omnitrophota bacterium]